MANNKGIGFLGPRKQATNNGGDGGCGDRDGGDGARGWLLERGMNEGKQQQQAQQGRQRGNFYSPPGAMAGPHSGRNRSCNLISTKAVDQLSESSIWSFELHDDEPVEGARDITIFDIFFSCRKIYLLFMVLSRSAFSFHM